MSDLNVAARQSPKSNGIKAGAMVAFGLLFAAAIVVGHFVGAGPVSHWFGDTDDFTRASRVLQMMNGGSWFDPILHGVGKGLEMHWTKPSDIAVLIGALPLQLMGMSAQSAVEYFSYVQPLLMLVGLAFAWLWAVKPFADRIQAGPSWGFAPVLLLPAIGWFMPMRIDHHALILVVATLLFGFSARTMLRQLSGREAVAAGMTLALALWVSVEQLLFVGCFLACLGGGWAVRGGREDARASLTAAMSGALAASVALVLERGTDLFGAAAMEIDRLSLFHVGILWAVVAGFGLIFAVGGAASLQGQAGRVLWMRTLIGGVAAGIAVGILILLQPQVLKGHVATAVDMTYVTLRSGFIKEGLETVSPAVLAQGGWSAILAGLLGDLLPAVIGALWLLVVMGRAAIQRSRESWGEVILWSAPLIWAVMFLGWQGWPTNANTVWLSFLGLAPSAAAMWWLSGLLKLRKARELASCVLILGLLVSGFMASDPDAAAVESGKAGVLKQAERGRTSACDKRVAIDALIRGGIGKGKTVMAYPDFGPAVMWRTGANVMSIPNHRVQPGFALSYDIFKTMDAAVAVEKLAQASVDAIVLCDGYAARPYYALLPSDGVSFGRQLFDGPTPAGLTRIDVSDPLGADLRIFVASGR